MHIIKPSRLEKSDTIGFIAPAYRTSRPKVTKAQKLFERSGFNVKIGKHIFDKYGFLAGTDDDRAADVMEMVEDESVNAIMCVVGGGGCTRLLPLLDFQSVRKHPKVFMGMSDFSVLLNAVYQKAGLVTFHGPNAQWLQSVQEVKELFKPLMRVQESRKVSGKSWKSLRPGSAEGVLMGGNLSMMTRLLGTEFDGDYHEKVFFWEELRQDADDFSQMLMQLKLAGIFSQMKGMVIGKQVGWENFYGMTPMMVVEELTKEFHFPILANADFGHFCKNVLMPIGIKARLDATARSLTFLESFVEP